MAKVFKCLIQRHLHTCGRATQIEKNFKVKRIDNTGRQFSLKVFMGSC